MIFYGLISIEVQDPFLIFYLSVMKLNILPRTGMQLKLENLQEQALKKLLNYRNATVV